MDLIEIQNRYKQIPFTQFRYLGNVKGYDIFDTGKEDLKDIQIFEDKYGIYTIEATSKSNLIYYDGEEMSQMTYLMNDGKILISDFYPADIYIKVTGGENENNNKWFW